METSQPHLNNYTTNKLKHPIRRLTRQQAEVVLEQFHETADYDQARLLAAAVMANHVHLVVGVQGDPEPEWLLKRFKAYASRRLNKTWQPENDERWWTRSGSTRRLPDELATRNAMAYVREQEFPLALWFDAEF